MFSNGSICKIVHIILIFVVVFFCFSGSSYTFEVKHDHAHFDEHCNAYSLVCNYSSDHGHSHAGDHEKSDSNNEHSHDLSDSSHSHTHLVSIDLPAAYLTQITSTLYISKAKYSFLSVSDITPDGPFYDLVKPPQLS